MLEDKIWDEREGDSYKTTLSALAVLVMARKNLPVSYAGRSKRFIFSEYLLAAFV